MGTVQAELAEKALPGAIDHEGNWVSFALYAPQKKSVHVIGSFNDWDRGQYPLEQREPGSWITAFQLDRGTHRYQFVIDDELVICDPYARQLAPGPEKGEQPSAIVEVGAEPYHWEHDGWLRHSFHDLILYEMHIGDFTEKGTFAAAMEKLDHLADLGVSAIELMPVYEASEGDYWGYQPTFLLAPRRSYGSPEDFCRFVDAAHAHDIAVLLDMVLAHTGHEHPFNRMYPLRAKSLVRLGTRRAESVWPADVRLPQGTNQFLCAGRTGSLAREISHRRISLRLSRRHRSRCRRQGPAQFNGAGQGDTAGRLFYR
jgi:1,4-alpha-glucan branching enzyme